MATNGHFDEEIIMSHDTPRPPETTEALSFNPHDPSFVEEGIPFDTLARIRREQPIFEVAARTWYLSRFQDV